MIASEEKIPRLDWLEPVKAFALIAILFNHLIEEIFDYRTVDKYNLLNIFGKIGDFGPGVFILVSGFGLTWAAIHRKKMPWYEFYSRRFMRIYPLYIALHFIFLGAAFFIPDKVLHYSSGYPMILSDPKMLFSILGLRFTKTLFFYISPAWWFVWLIVQLYLVFPLLFEIQKKLSITYFIIGSCVITFAFRAAYLIFPEIDLFNEGFWMLGIFCGTRLAEFSIGMAFAKILYKNQVVMLFSNQGRLLFWSFILFTAGLGLYTQAIGKIVAQVLISVGMTGLFFVAWKSVASKNKYLSNALVWIGTVSYSVYLFHQPPLQLTKALAQKSLGMHLIAAIFIILISFPIGSLVTENVTKLIKIGRKIKESGVVRIISFAFSICGIIFVVILSTSESGNQRIIPMFMGLALTGLIYSEYASSPDEKLIENNLRRITGFLLVVKLFAFHSNLGTVIGLALSIVIVIISAIYGIATKSTLKVWAYSLLTVAVIILSLEAILNYIHPLESGRWGEAPVLQIDPTRIYSLKNNITYRLRYNDYDYVIKTNSFGMTSPEIDPHRKQPNIIRILVIGDAFSMPEGFSYEYSYPSILEKRINKKIDSYKVQVLNAGVTGYGPVEQLAQLKELCLIFYPDIVIYQFFIDEFGSMNINPEKLQKDIGLISCFDSGDCNFAERSQIVRHAIRIVTPIIEKIMPEIIAQRNYGNCFIGFYKKGDNGLYSTENLKKMKYYLSEMNDVCKQTKSKFIIYFTPGAVSVSKPEDIANFPEGINLNDSTKFDLDLPFSKLQTITSKLKIAVSDLRSVLENNPDQPVYFSTSWHWNKNGHQLVAETIEKDLFSRGWLKLDCAMSCAQ
jgi:peptidoglycan/LPS O-acetylase OafA/YrhL